MRYSDEKMVTIDKELHKLLKTRAAKEETSMKALTNKFLRKALEVN